jgi:hypothetical protein
MSFVEPDRMRRAAGWSAYVSVGLDVVGAVFLFLFYALEAPHMTASGDASPRIFGPLSDTAGLFSSAFMLPMPIALYQLTTQRSRGLGWAAMAFGVLGLLTTIIAQTLLMAHAISSEANLPFTLGGLALIGVWMSLASHLGRSEDALAPRLAWLGELTGAVLAVEVGVVFLIVLAAALNPAVAPNLSALAQQSRALIGVVIVLVIPGALAYFFGAPIWLIGLGRGLLAAPVGSVQSNWRRAPMSAQETQRQTLGRPL